MPLLAVDFLAGAVTRRIDAGPVAEIHDRMPLILAPVAYSRWLDDEPDPRELMRPFPAGPMRMGPISTRVNKPENDDPSIIESIELTAATAS